MHVSRFSGPMGPSQKNGRNKGVMREIRHQKRIEAEVRDELLADDSPVRRRNKGAVIVAPVVEMQAAATLGG